MINNITSIVILNYIQDINVMQDHKQVAHEPTVMRQCPYCPKQIVERNFRAHVRKVHESSGTCQICNTKVKLRIYKKKESK